MSTLEGLAAYKIGSANTEAIAKIDRKRNPAEISYWDRPSQELKDITFKITMAGIDRFGNEIYKIIGETKGTPLPILPVPTLQDVFDNRREEVLITAKASNRKLINFKTTIKYEKDNKIESFSISACTTDAKSWNGKSSSVSKEWVETSFRGS